MDKSIRIKTVFDAMPEPEEDTRVVSEEEYAKLPDRPKSALSFKPFERRVIEVGQGKFGLNVYDRDNTVFADGE